MVVLTMRKQRYTVTLTESEREELKQLIAAGTAPARKLTHARVLLKADQSPQGPGWVDERIAEAVEVSQPTISRIRKQYVEEGLEAALNRRAPKREYHRKLDGEQEARLVALACSEPLVGKRWVDVTEHRTKVDWAHQIKELVDERYPDAERIVLVLDNLNTHTPASLYEAFEPREAKRLADKLELHYTPKHGSWLGYPLGAGRDRVERAEPPVPGPTGARLRDVGGRGRGVAAGA